MIRTRVGYAGGTTKYPSYRDIGDHTETFQVDFDPAVVDYGRLLALFWASHDPTARPWSRQYMAAVFVHDEAQRAAAEASKAALEERLGRKVRTPILDAGPFTIAEDYHQKYTLRNRAPLMAVVRPLFPTEAAFAASTAAARLNGLLAGHGTRAAVLEAFEAEGLSQEGLEDLSGLLAPLGEERSGAGCGAK